MIVPPVGGVASSNQVFNMKGPRSSEIESTTKTPFFCHKSDLHQRGSFITAMIISITIPTPLYFYNLDSIADSGIVRILLFKILNTLFMIVDLIMCE
jgi:hypothetical protein